MTEPWLAVVLGLGKKPLGLVPVQEMLDGRVRIIQQALEPLRQQTGRVASSHPRQVCTLASPCQSIFGRRFDTPPLPSG